MPLLLSQAETMLIANATFMRQEPEPSKEPHMTTRALNTLAHDSAAFIPHVDLSYDNENSEATALELVYRIQPHWRSVSSELEITKFTDGITNTLLRVARRRPGASQDEVDNESILMRAYGNNTDLIIDRNREARSHALLAERGMAPPLLARFNNGLLYKYIAGKVCTPENLTQEPVWRGVARKLGEWHARVPISAVATRRESQTHGVNGVNGQPNGYTNGTHFINDKVHRTIKNRSPEPNVWSVLQKWVDTLPVSTEKERARRNLLQCELERTFQELDNKNGIGEEGFVFGHLDLLSANVIMLPTKSDTTLPKSEPLPVTFIDYEYATPCPAAFDIANHFAEWAGYDLDYNRLPTKTVRRAFLKEYLSSYNEFASEKVSMSVLSSLDEEVNRWRGIPGLWWGIWSLIQAKISQIDFDYAQYAEDRLSEYWAWRAETSGTRASTGTNVPLRERRWAQEA